MPKKQVDADTEGEELASYDITPELDVCCVCGLEENIRRCSGCKSARYCSKECQRQHHSYHQVYCNAIGQLEKFEKQKLYGSRSVRQELLDFKKQARLAKLVGKKPMLSCWLDGKAVEALWDTGSQISIVDRHWLERNFPNEPILPVEDFLDGDEKELKIQAANKGEIPFDGLVLLKFSLREGDGGFYVPILVASYDMADPIIGYNAMEYLVLHGTDKERADLKECLKTSSPFSVEALISLIENQASDPDFLGEIKASKFIKVPAGCKARIQCRVKAQSNSSEQTVYFEPKIPEGDDELTFNEAVCRLRRGRTNYVDIEVINTSRIDKTLTKGTMIGSVHSVAAVIPMMRRVNVQPAKKKEVKVNAVNTEESTNNVEEDGETSKKKCDDLLPEFDLSHLNEEQQQKMRKILEEVKDVFSCSDSDIGDVKEFQMKIQLTGNIPVKEPYRKIPRPMYAEVKNYIDDLISNGWVRESCSSYSSPIVCVRKKDGGMRLCIDYRKLNNKTVPDAQPIPRIQDILDSLGGKRWFSTLDMSKAYHQGYIAEEFRHMTAFSTPWTLLEWIRIPFGLRNSPPAFQRFINQMLGDLKGIICEPYLDDILVHSETFDEHLQDLKKVLCRLLARGIKLRGIKCSFAKQEVRYLGRLISADGYRPDPTDTAALEKFRTPPETIGELRSLLGFLGYYRTYVKGFAAWVKPMYDLLKGKCRESKQKGEKKKGGQCYNAKEKIVWNSELQKILDDLLDYLKSPEVMAYPDYSLPFFLTTDASGYGLGAVLYQTQGGVDRVIGYASRTLTEAEQNYHFHSGKLEFLALKWAVTERFADYLQAPGPQFIIYTDNNPLTYILTTAKLNAVALRWVNELADYNFTIKYRPGKTNTDADYFSRRPLKVKELKESCTETMDPGCLNAVLTGAGRQHEPSSCCVSVSKLTLEGEPSVGAISRETMMNEQKVDKVIGPVYSAVQLQNRPSRKKWKELVYESRLLMQHWNKLKIREGVLMRETSRGFQIVLPEKYHKLVFIELHEKLAHLGADRVVELARQRFFWPKMARDITNYVKKKCRCIADKRPNVAERAKLMPIESNYPFEVVAIDFIHLDKCKGNFEYVLVVTDLFTKFVQMYATKKKSSKAAAAKLFHEFILGYGFPKRIMHDKGPEFNSDLFAELHRLTGIKSSNTTPYHPMANGQCERMNRSLVAMLKSLSSAEKRNWKEVLPKLSFAYNSTQHATTGFTPFFMMFGRESRLPIDEIFQEIQMEEQGKLRCRSHQQFVDEWKRSMKEVFRVAREKSEVSQAYNKKKYDGKVKEIGIEAGDHVLVKNLREKGGTGKLKSHWEHQIFKVVRQQGDLPVFQVTSLDNPRDVRVLHRNHLMKCEELPFDVFKEVGSMEESNAKKKKKAVSSKPKEQKQLLEELSGEESEEDDIVVAMYADGGNILQGDRDPVIELDESEIPELVVVDPMVEAADSPHVEESHETLDHFEVEPSDDSDSLPAEESDGTSNVEIEPLLEESNDVEESSEDVNEDKEIVQRSAHNERVKREKIPKKFYTYKKLGGNPSFTVLS